MPVVTAYNEQLLAKESPHGNPALKELVHFLIHTENGISVSVVFKLLDKMRTIGKHLNKAYIYPLTIKGLI